MKMVYKVSVQIMTELQYAITKAIPSVTCPNDMINIISRRVWLEKEIVMLAARGKIIEDETSED